MENTLALQLSFRKSFYKNTSGGLFLYEFTVTLKKTVFGPLLINLQSYYVPESKTFEIRSFC